MPIFGKKLKKLLVYSHASVRKVSEWPTRIFPPMKNTADRNSRIAVSGHQNVGEHRSCCRLSVCTGNGDRCIVVAHDLSEQLGTGQHRNTGSFCSGKFRIVRMDGCGINNKVGSRKNVFCLLTVENLCAKRSQVAGQVTFFCIGTGNCKAFF